MSKEKSVLERLNELESKINCAKYDIAELQVIKNRIVDTIKANSLISLNKEYKLFDGSASWDGPQRISPEVQRQKFSSEGYHFIFKTCEDIEVWIKNEE